jgi:hypothetical protein
MHSDTSLSGAACTSGITSNKLVQSSSENDNLICHTIERLGDTYAHWLYAGLKG